MNRAVEAPRRPAARRAPTSTRFRADATALGRPARPGQAPDPDRGPARAQAPGPGGGLRVARRHAQRRGLDALVRGRARRGRRGARRRARGSSTTTRTTAARRSALRDWLNGPARDLAHRDDPLDARSIALPGGRLRPPPRAGRGDAGGRGARGGRPGRRRGDRLGARPGGGRVPARRDRRPRPGRRRALRRRRRRSTPGPSARRARRARRGARASSTTWRSPTASASAAAPTSRWPSSRRRPSQALEALRAAAGAGAGRRRGRVRRRGVAQRAVVVALLALAAPLYRARRAAPARRARPTTSGCARAWRRASSSSSPTPPSCARSARSPTARDSVAALSDAEHERAVARGARRARLLPRHRVPLRGERRPRRDGRRASRCSAGRVSLTHALVAVLVTAELFALVRRYGAEFHRREGAARGRSLLSGARRARATGPAAPLVVAEGLVTAAGGAPVEPARRAGVAHAGDRAFGRRARRRCSRPSSGGAPRRRGHADPRARAGRRRRRGAGAARGQPAREPGPRAPTSATRRLRDGARRRRAHRRALRGPRRARRRRRARLQRRRDGAPGAGARACSPSPPSS